MDRLLFFEIFLPAVYLPFQQMHRWLIFRRPRQRLLQTLQNQRPFTLALQARVGTRISLRKNRTEGEWRLNLSPACRKRSH